MHIEIGDNYEGNHNDQQLAVNSLKPEEYCNHQYGYTDVKELIMSHEKLSNMVAS